MFSLQAKSVAAMGQNLFIVTSLHTPKDDRTGPAMLFLAGFQEIPENDLRVRVEFWAFRSGSQPSNAVTLRQFLIFIVTSPSYIIFLAPS